MSNFGQRFMEMRKALEFTQKEFADHLDISLSTLQAYENGKLPKGEVLKTLQNDGFDINWLLGGTGEMCLPLGETGSPSRLELERMLIWNVAYFMCKRSGSDEDPHDYANAFMLIFDKMKLSEKRKILDEEEAQESNVVDFFMRKTQ